MMRSHLTPAPPSLSAPSCSIPILVEAWFFGGRVKMWLGELDTCIGRLAHATPLNPLGRRAVGIHSGIAHAHFMGERHDEASHWAAMTLQSNPDIHSALRISGASHALAGG